MRRGVLIVVLATLVSGCGDSEDEPPCRDPACCCPGIMTNCNIDPNNCGACGNNCASGKTCSGGKCVCPLELTDCNGTCVDTRSDVHNCGACGRECPAADCDGNPVPCIGVCWTGCPPDTCVCGSACVDPSADALNCGSCGNACASGQSCLNGTCS